MQTTETKYPRGVVEEAAAVRSASKPCFIKDGRALLRIIKHQVVYLSADGHVCNLFLSTHRAPLVLSSSFSSIAAKLSDVLTLVRRGTAVNLQYASAIKEGSIYIESPHHNLDIAYTQDNYENILSSINVL